MSKFHINRNGEPRPCHASVRDCPVGGAHFDSEKEARDYYEKSMSGKSVATLGATSRSKRSYPLASESEREARKRKLKRSSTVIAVGAAAVLATSLTGCSSSDDYSQVKQDYVRICQDHNTQKRVDDKSCENQGSGGHVGSAMGWYYMAMNNKSDSNIPKVGDKVSGGVSKIPAGKSFARGFSAKGGSAGHAAEGHAGGFGHGGEGGGHGG